MPELHANQIRWEAPEPQKASFDSVNYQPLAEAFNTLGRAANELSEYKAKIDDTEARAVMNKTADEAYVELSKYEPSDENYEPALQKFRDTLRSQMAQFGSDVQTRFNRDLPTFFDEQELKANELVFDKQQKRYIQKAGQTATLLASEVVEGKKSNEQARKELEDMVANIDNVSAQEILYNYKHMVQMGNVENLVAGGAYGDALKLVENPEESDTLTPEQRISIKSRIQRMIKEEAAMREKMLKQATADSNSRMEDGLTYAMLNALDHNDDRFAKLVSIVDNPQGTIDLYDEQGNVVAQVTAESIPVTIRRKALKNVRTYVQDSQSYRMQSYRAKTLADNLVEQAVDSYGNVRSADVFNNAYDFMQSPDFQVYLDEKDQQKIYDMVYGEAYRYNETIIPYSNVREDNWLYGAGLKKQSAPSPQRIVTGYVFGDEGQYYSAGKMNYDGSTNPVRLNPMASDNKGILPDVDKEFFANPQRGFRQLTEQLFKQYKKEVGKSVEYGSEMEYLINTYAFALSCDAQKRKQIGLQYVSDESLGMAFARMKNMLISTNRADNILTQSVNPAETEAQLTIRADKIRKEIFDTFYSMAHNTTKDIVLDDEQTAKRSEFKQIINSATWNRGSGNYTGATVHKTPEYPLGEKHDKDIKKARKKE